MDIGISIRRWHLSAALIAAAAVLSLAPTAAFAGGNPQHPASGIAPSFQEQTKSWTTHQWAMYNTKTSRARRTAGTRQVSSIAASVSSTPTSRTLNMGPWGLQQESPDYMCGPATISEMYSHYSINIPQGTAAADMGTNSAGTIRGSMQTESNKYQGYNPYVWTNVGPNGGGTVNNSGPADLKYYTADDIGNWGAAVAYDIETYGSHGYVLPKYNGVDWKHYFPGVAYTSLGSYIAVNDPHWPSQDWYSNTTLWYATDNFTGPNGSFVPNQVLY